MYCTLIKKVSESKCDHLTKISTNLNTNAMAFGGINGFLKVVNFEASTKKHTNEENSKPHLRYAQSLYLHTEEITIITWNDNYNKLTTCDKKGQIVVWECTKEGNWKEEMTNSRDESYVADVKWSKLGNFLCFIYDDGHTIVGTVEGNRLWGNDIEKKLYLLEWTPDGSKILLATKSNNVLVISSAGVEIGKMNLEPSMKKKTIVSMTWWTNLFSQNRSITMDKHLLIAFEHGVVCLYNDEEDIDPFVIQTNLSAIYKSEWNLIGDVFAVCGMIKSDNSTGVSFYSFKGDLIRILRAPDPIVSFTWDSTSTKIALEVNDAVYLALVKPKYKWCFFSNTLVYAFLNEQEHYTLVYWDTLNNKNYHKYVKNMLDITSSTYFCLVTAKISEKSFLVILSIANGSPVDNKIVNFDPDLIAVNNTHAIVSNRNDVYIWQFRSLREETEEPDLSNQQEHELTSSILKRSKMKEISFVIDDTPSMKNSYNHELYHSIRQTKDPICAIYLSESYFFLARLSGQVRKYTLIDLSNFEEFTMKSKFIKIGSSPNGQYFWGIDSNNHLTIWNTEAVKAKGECEKLNFERKEVWSLLWSTDNILSFSFLEKSQLMVVNNLVVEDILPCNGYLADFSKVDITLVKLEELMYKPWENQYIVHDIVIKLETKVLRHLKDLMNEKTPIDEVYNYIKKNSDHHLWNTLTVHSLNNLDFSTAKKGMVENSDLMGLKFVDQVKQIDDVKIQKAEVEKFNQNYEEADKIFMENDRKDLSIEMRIKLGHWDKVINMVEGCEIINDDNLRMSYINNANQLVEAKEYGKAEEYYKKAGDIEGLVNVWLSTDEYDKAARYIDKLPEQNDFLMFMGNKFETQGLCEEAVNCYLRFGDIKKAIDVSVKMNKWNLALELAEKGNLFENESLVNQFGNILIEKNRKIDLIELYLKANRHTDAAIVLQMIAEDLRALNLSPSLIKKIYVLSALEYDFPKIKLKDSQAARNHKKANLNQDPTSFSLKTSDFNTLSDQTLNNVWKGAEAMHFYMLCQAQLHQKKINEAFKTSLRLVLYEKELYTKEVYRLIALSSYLNKSYGECSKALSKLEQLPNLTRSEQERYSELSNEIFAINRPVNGESKQLICPTKTCNTPLNDYDINCKKCGSNFSACVVSGQSIFHKDYFKCKRCKHKSIKSEVIKKSIKTCPLCHVSLEVVKS